MSIVIEDGIIVKAIQHNALWDGLYSRALANGPIIKYILAHIPKNVIMVIPRSDGNINRNKLNYHDVDWDTQIQPYIDEAKMKNKIFVLGVLCQVIEEPDVNYLYLPLDDDFFLKGVNHFFNSIPWHEKDNNLCWRGGCSGVGHDQSLRIKFVKKIYDYNPNTNVRLSWWWSEGKNIASNYFSGRLDAKSFLNYKIFFIVDGNCIASNHMWGFATGSIPFLISNGKCWFSDLIVPYQHYIPINYDLSNLIEQIEWVKNNDHQAKIIADNAYQFSSVYFSSEYQKQYLKNKLNV